MSPDLFYVQTSPTVVRDLENLSSSIAKNELHPLIGAVVSRCTECVWGGGGGVQLRSEGLVSLKRWSCSKVSSCVVECTMGRLRDWSL